MGYLELGELDRKKYGLPERVEFLHHRYGMRSIKALRTHTGYDYDLMTRLLDGVPKVDPETNEAVYTDEKDADGNTIYEDDGVTPKRKLVLVQDEDALAAFIWLILWDAGYRLDWDTFNPRYGGLKLRIADDIEEPGKALTEPSTTTQETSDSPTGNTNS